MVMFEPTPSYSWIKRIFDSNDAKFKLLEEKILHLEEKNKELEARVKDLESKPEEVNDPVAIVDKNFSESDLLGLFS